jgi:hypothetical protein
MHISWRILAAATSLQQLHPHCANLTAHVAAAAQLLCVQYTTNAKRYDIVYTTRLNATTCAAETPRSPPTDPFQDFDGVADGNGVDTCWDADAGGKPDYPARL